MPTAKKLPVNTNVNKGGKIANANANANTNVTVTTNTKKASESSMPADKKDTIKKPPTMKEIRKKAAGLRDEMQILSVKRRKVNQEIEGIAALVKVKEATRVYAEVLYQQEEDNSTAEEKAHTAEKEEEDKDDASANDEEEEEEEDEDEDDEDDADDSNAGGKTAAAEEDDSDDADEAEVADK